MNTFTAIEFKTEVNRIQSALLNVKEALKQLNKASSQMNEEQKQAVSSYFGWVELTADGVFVSSHQNTHK